MTLFKSFAIQYDEQVFNQLFLTVIQHQNLFFLPIKITKWHGHFRSLCEF